MNQNPYPPRDPYAGAPPPGYGIGNQGGPLVYRNSAPSSAPEAERPSSGIVSFHFLSALAPVLGFLIGGVLLALGILQAGPDNPPGGMFFAGMGLMCLGFLGYMVCSILRMIWYYQIWSWIPPSHRVTKNWSGGMTPTFAALGHLIPYFNIYWAFAATLATCDALDMLAAQYTPGRVAPRGTGMAMAICSIVFFPVAPFLMHSFMKECGRMAEQIDQERSRTGALGPGI